MNSLSPRKYKLTFVVAQLANEGILSDEKAEHAHEILSTLSLPEQQKIFGEIALQKQYLSENELQNALEHQQKIQEQGIHLKIGDILWQQDVLTIREVSDILEYQRQFNADEHTESSPLYKHLPLNMIQGLPPVFQFFMNELLKQEVLPPESLQDTIKIFFQQRSERAHLSPERTDPIEQNLVSEEEYSEVQEIQETLKNLGLSKPLGEILVEKKLATQKEIVRTLEKGEPPPEDQAAPPPSTNQPLSGKKMNRLQSNQSQKGWTSTIRNVGASVVILGLLSLTGWLLFLIHSNPNVRLSLKIPDKSSANTNNTSPPTKNTKSPAAQHHTSTENLIQKWNTQNQQLSNHSKQKLERMISKQNKLLTQLENFDQKQQWNHLVLPALQRWFQVQLENIHPPSRKNKLDETLAGFQTTEDQLHQLASKFSNPPKPIQRALNKHPALQSHFRSRVQEKIDYLNNKKKQILHTELYRLEKQFFSLLQSAQNPDNPEHVLQKIQQKTQTFRRQIQRLPKNHPFRQKAQKRLNTLRTHADRWKKRKISSRSMPDHKKASPNHSDRESTGKQKPPTKTEPPSNTSEDEKPEEKEYKPLKLTSLSRKDLQNIRRKRPENWSLNQSSLSEKNPPSSIQHGFETEHFILLTTYDKQRGREMATLAEAVYELHQQILGQQWWDQQFQKHQSKWRILFLHNKQQLNGLDEIVKKTKGLTPSNKDTLISLVTGRTKNDRQQQKRQKTHRKMQSVIGNFMLQTMTERNAPWWLQSGWYYYLYFGEFHGEPLKLRGGAIESPASRQFLRTAKRAFFHFNLNLDAFLSRSSTITGGKNRADSSKPLSWSFIHFFLHGYREQYRDVLTNYIKKLASRSSGSNGRSHASLFKKIIKTEWPNQSENGLLFRMWKGHVWNLLSTWKPWKASNRDRGYNANRHIQRLKNLGQDVLSDGTLSINHPGAVSGNRLWNNPWTFSSTHYNVKTTISPRAAKEVAFVMELINYNYRKLFDLQDKYIPKMDVLIPRNKAQYKHIRGKSQKSSVVSGGYFHPIDEELVVYYQHRNNNWNTARILLHEGTHQFFYLSAQTELPAWLNEGLAEYMRAARFKSYTNLKLGEVSPVKNSLKRVKKWMKHGLERKLKFKTLINAKQLKRAGYDLAWSLVHFLLHGKRGRYASRFKQYVRSFLTFSKQPKSPRDRFRTYFRNRNRLKQDWKTHVQSLSPK